MIFGIDKISFYIPNYFIDLKTLSIAENKPKDFYTSQTGQYKMAVPAPNEDMVTLASNAAYTVLQNEQSTEAIELLLFATESGLDHSKAAGLYVHQLLQLPSSCRVFELKQACYGATAGLQMAIPYLQQNPKAKVLLIASDIARYEPHTAAEASQGSGAVAMLLSANPRILAIEPESGYYTENVMDFWRPYYRQEALVNSILSCHTYLKALKHTWLSYQKKSSRNFNDHAGFCYHVPVPRLVEKAHQRLAKIANHQLLSCKEAHLSMQSALTYAREIGNCYTASLYLSLLSLLENSSTNLANQRIGLYSYGSGCSAEYFSGIVQPHYTAHLNTQEHRQQFTHRQTLSYTQYQDFFHYSLPTDGQQITVPQHTSGHYTLASLNKHQRFYQATT